MFVNSDIDLRTLYRPDKELNDKDRINIEMRFHHFDNLKELLDHDFWKVVNAQRGLIRNLDEIRVRPQYTPICLMNAANLPLYSIGYPYCGLLFDEELVEIYKDYKRNGGFAWRMELLHKIHKGSHKETK